MRVADRLGEWAHGTVVVRLAHTLATCALANEQRMVSETHDQLAWLTGASRATVTKELQQLRAMGLIAFSPHHHGIHVPDPERLLTL
jgi:biotin operon repressor